MNPGGPPVLRVADVVGRLMEFWGFKRNMGRLWCVLYLAPEPLSAADLAERLSLSAGAISMTLSDLSRWGVVKKAWVPGERRDYYEPETDIWKMVSRVFRERELQKIRAAADELRDAREALAAERDAPETTADSATELEHARRRIDSLLTLTEIGARLIESILEGRSIDTEPIKGFDLD